MMSEESILKELNMFKMQESSEKEELLPKIDIIKAEEKLGTLYKKLQEQVIKSTLQQKIYEPAESTEANDTASFAHGFEKAIVDYQKQKSRMAKR